MSAFCQETDVDQGGASGEAITEDQEGSPEREMDVTSQPRATADLQIREPFGEKMVSWCVLIDT